MIVLYALLGLVVGAAVNLCADQLPRWRRVRRMPFCPACSEPHPPWAWVSTLAYLALRPRCRQCGARIPWRHLVVELSTALLFAFVWQRYAGTVYLPLFSIYGAILILVIAIDLEHRLILNVVMYPSWGLALLGSLLHPDEPFFWRRALMGLALGFGLLFLVYQFGVLFVKIMSRARGKPVNAVAFGFGDVRLGGFMGLVLGFPTVLTAIFLAMLLGGAVGLIYWFVRAIVLRRYSLFTAIPYGPFLVTGTLALMFFEPEINQWLMGR